MVITGYGSYNGVDYYLVKNRYIQYIHNKSRDKNEDDIKRRRQGRE